MATHPSFKESYQKFFLSGAEDMNEEIGKGSYCTVIKMKFRGLVCAGKRLHQLFKDIREEDKDGVIKRFAEECELLSQLRHPNIVQFLGICECEDGLPILIMEYMDQSLTSWVEQCGSLTEGLAFPILHDVALGLAYLHGYQPSIIHRDLSANNILLTAGRRAKISDLGVARIINVSPSDRAKLTMCPGTPAYMPPESFESNPTYDTKMDCFAFGVLIIHVLSGEWPVPSAPTRVDPRDEGLVAVSEFDRRTQFVQKISPDSNLRMVAESCLNNIPSSRPSAYDILDELNKISLSNRTTDKSPEQHQEENAFLKDQLEAAKSKLQATEEEMASLALAYSSCESQSQAKSRELELAQSELTSLRQTFKPLQDVITTQGKALEEKEIVLSSLSGQLSQVKSVKSQVPNVQFQWERCGDLPLVASVMKSVYTKGMLCVGGGHSDEVVDRRKIFKTSDLKTWTSFPLTPVMFYGLTEHSGNLLLVSGLTADAPGKTVFTWMCDPLGSAFTLVNIPCVLSKRSHTGMTTIYNTWLLLVGGISEKGEVMSNCDVLKIGDANWVPFPSLPKPVYSPSCLFFNGKVYVTGGYANLKPLQPNKDVFCLTWETREWHKLCTAPMTYATYTTVCGMLACIGGLDEGGKRTADLMVFSEESKTWVKLGEVPEVLNKCSTTALPTGEIVVIGSNNTTGNCSHVYKGRLSF